MMIFIRRVIEKEVTLAVGRQGDFVVSLSVWR